MASQTRKINITWENNVGLTVQTQLDSGTIYTVIDVDEDGHLAKMWDSGLKKAIMTFIETEIDSIGTEMKA